MKHEDMYFIIYLVKIKNNPTHLHGMPPLAYVAANAVGGWE